MWGLIEYLLNPGIARAAVQFSLGFYGIFLLLAGAIYVRASNTLPFRSTYHKVYVSLGIFFLLAEFSFSEYMRSKVNEGRYTLKLLEASKASLDGEGVQHISLAFNQGAVAVMIIIITLGIVSHGILPVRYREAVVGGFLRSKVRSCRTLFSVSVLLRNLFLLTAYAFAATVIFDAVSQSGDTTIAKAGGSHVAAGRAGDEKLDLSEADNPSMTLSPDRSEVWFDENSWVFWLVIVAPWGAALLGIALANQINGRRPAEAKELDVELMVDELELAREHDREDLALERVKARYGDVHSFGSTP